MTPEEWQAFQQEVAKSAGATVAARLAAGYYSPAEAAGIVAQAQARAVGPAAEYVAGFSAAEFVEGVNGSLLVGIASDGRSLEGLMTVPAVTMANMLATGSTRTAATASAAHQARALAETMSYDAGRIAASLNLTADRSIKGYRRVLKGDTNCARCIILAGKFYRWNAGFQRHPQCDCEHEPIPAGAAETPYAEPEEVFKGLPEAEQDRVFTKAGAQAIRDGADINQVVNARRGMRTTVSYSQSGRTSRTLTTTEGATRRRRGRDLADLRGPRLMPETIYKRAGSRDEAISLLRQHGYLTGSAQGAALPTGERNVIRLRAA